MINRFKDLKRGFDFAKIHICIFKKLYRVKKTKYLKKTLWLE